MEHPGLRAAAPFAACTILGTGLAFLPQFGDRTGVALVALVANLMAGGLFAWILSGRRRTWRDPALVICLAVGLAALFDATGGTSSPLMPLVAVPVLWAGLFGARRDLLLVTLLTIALLVLPIVLVGGERYATSGLARAALWASISLLIGPAVQETVRNWRHERARHARLSRELADANARWRFVVDTIPQTALATLDDDLRIGLVAGSDVWSVGFGGSEGRLFGDYASPENTRTIRRLVDKAMGGELVGTSMISSHNGRELEILISRLVASDPDAEPPREVLLLARDVHQERRREREVVRERDRAERYFSESPHGIAVIGPDGVVRRANPALCQLTSTTQAELVGQPLEALVEKGTTVREHLERVFGTGQRAQVRLALRSAAGDPRPVAVSSSLMPGDAADVGLDGTVADDEDSVLMHVVDMSEQERYENRLTYLANHDPLTGLANRRRFEEELERHLDRCRRYGARGAVLMLDLDHFKEVNDTLGHPAGDELIVKLGTLLRRRLRSSDLVARLGGDEFAVLLPEVDRAGAEQTARGLVTAVREEVATMEGAAHRVTA